MIAVVVSTATADLEELEARLAAAERVLIDRDVDQSLERQREVADALLFKADALRDVFHQRAALECVNEVIAHAGKSSDPGLQRRLISARRIRAAILLALRRWEEALSEANAVVASTEEEVDAELRWCLASALMSQAGSLMRLGRLTEVERSAVRLSDEFAADPWQGPRQANMIGVGLLMRAEAIAAQERRPEAGRLATELVERFVPEREPSTRALIVRATNLMARLAWDDGRSDEALNLRQQVLEQYGDATRPWLRNAVGGVGIAHAIALSRLGRTEEALSVLDKMLDRLDADRDPRLNPALELRTAALKAVYLSRDARNDEAVAACDSVIAHYEAAPPPDIEQELAELLRTKASSLAAGGRVTEAIRVLDEVCNRFDDERLSRGLIARALLQSALLSRRANRPGEALSTCQDIVDRFGKTPPPETPWVVLDALHQIPFALGALGRHREAVRACDDVVEEFGAEDDLAARRAVSDILGYKAHLLAKRGRTHGAVRALDAVLERAAGSAAPELERVAMRAQDSRAALLIRRNDAWRLRIAMLAPFVALAVLAGLGRRAGKALSRRISGA